MDDLTLIHTLEYFKYFTLQGKLIVHSSPSAEFVDYKDVQISTPEGKDFLVKSMRFNYFKPQDKRDNFIRVNWGVNGLLKPSLSANTNNTTNDKVYIFHSEEFDALSEENKQSEKLFFNSNVTKGGFWGHIYSVIIQIDGDSVNDFEAFMNMPLGDVDTYGTWRFHINSVFSYSNLEDFLKYPYEIILKEIGADKIKIVLKGIADYWDTSYGTYSQSQKQDFVFGLLEKVQDKTYAKEIYKFFFDDGAFYFRRYNSLIDEGDLLKFTFFLLKLFYMKIDMDVYEKEIKNLPKDHILPIIKEDTKRPIDGIGLRIITIGPSYRYLYDNNGLSITSFLFMIFKNGITNRPIDPNNPKENVFPYLGINHFAYDEIIGLICCHDRPEVGLMRGMIYPVPAFAFGAFQSGLSTDYTIWNFINDMSNAAGVIFPFFKILQAEAVIVNLIALLIGETGLMLDSYPALQEKLKTTVKGRAFLYSYYFVSGFYGNLEQGQVITDAFRKNRIKAIFDFENLLSMWGAFYADPSDFSTVADDPNIEGLKKIMNDIQREYNDNKKVK